MILPMNIWPSIGSFALIKPTMSLILVAVMLSPVAGCTKAKGSPGLWERFKIKSSPAAAAGAPSAISTSPVAKISAARAISAPSYSLCADCLLLAKGQSAVHARPDTIKGMLEKIHVMGEKVQFLGWAADVGASGPVEMVLFFADGRLVHESTALIERLDVAKYLADGGVLRSGFSVILDKALFVNAAGGEAAIDIYALAKDNMTAKLPFKKN
mgnify:CR=1 FL=1